jgi:hypothetical protein
VGALGHSSIVTTADTYTGVLPEAAHHAAQATADMIIQAARSVPGARPGAVPVPTSQPPPPHPATARREFQLLNGLQEKGFRVIVRVRSQLAQQPGVTQASATRPTPFVILAGSALKSSTG